MDEIACIDGTELRVRPIAVTDVERLARLLGRLSRKRLLPVLLADARGFRGLS